MLQNNLKIDAKLCKFDQETKYGREDAYFNVTQSGSIYDSVVFFNFAALLITGKDLLEGKGGKVSCGDEVEQKALYLSQYILDAICKVDDCFCIHNI